MVYKGIDVSKWNGTIDWAKVKESKINFAIIREGWGKKSPNQIDKQFKNNYENAKRVGINVGVYHYSYADSVLDAKYEAEFCLENIKGMQFEYPICFDIEDKEQMKLDNRERTDIVKAFCSEIEKAGYYTMFYCNLNWLNNYLYRDELLPKYDLWLAQWDIASPAVKCGIWQKSDCGHISGISGNVDIDIAYKDYPTIIKSKKLNGFKNQKPNPIVISIPYQNTQQSTSTYIVKKGDTLSSIASKFGLSVKQIADINNITDINKIYEGQLLKINDTKTYYTVKYGDNATKIAQKYGITVQEIARLNGLENPNIIYVGQKLRIK